MLLAHNNVLISVEKKWNKKVLDSPEENMRVGKSDGIGCVRYPDGHWSFSVMAEKWKENWSHRKIKAYMMITRRVVAMHFFFEIFYCIE